MTQAALFNLQMIVMLALLALAMIVDLRHHRIPNALTGGGIVLGLVLQAAAGGVDSFVIALGGLLVGGLALLPSYAVKAMGAGDVKLMALVGTFLGPFTTLLAVGATLVAGGLIALAVLLYQRGGRELLDRYRAMLMHATVMREFRYLRPTDGAAAAHRFPYAAAIAVGAVAAAIYTSRLSGIAALVAA